MSFDMNDAEPQKTNEIIPDGTFAKVTLTLRKGGLDGESEIDKGLLKPSNSPGSDVLMLDCEFTVTEGPHARRKFWQMLTVSGGKVDEKGVSLGWKITKSTIRAMIDSALGLDPTDMSDVTKAKRVLRGFADLNGITFIAKIKVESSDNPRYSDSNKLDRVVLSTEPEWRKVMDGVDVPPAPHGGRKKTSSPATANAAPAWGQNAPPAASAPAWNQPQPQQTPASNASTAATPAVAAQGPAWLNG